MKRIFSVAKPAPCPDQKMVEVGNRFFQIDMGHAVWEVERICSSSACDIPHIVITTGGTCPQTKILSVSALLNGTNFQPDRRDPDRKNESGQQRRYTDYLRN